MITSKFPQILVDTGFTPRWVELQKEIRLEVEALKKELEKSRLVGFSILKVNRVIAIKF